MLQSHAFTAVTPDGWVLSLHRAWDPHKLVTRRRPVLIVPGYGMNSFIFGYHPNGWSLEGWLVERGFEVFRVDLRAQGDSRYEGPDPDAKERFRLEDLAVTDLTTVIDAVLAHSESGADRVDLIGASLGGTLMFSHSVLVPQHRIGSMVAMGSPVRWVKINPVLGAAFKSPQLIGLLRIRGARKLAAVALPQLARFTPWLLSMYLNPAITETRAAREMVKTVEDPNRFINRQIAHWVNAQDLRLRDARGHSMDIGKGLASVDRPLLCVIANGDGIVPRETALWPYQATGAKDRTLLEVGDEDVALAHADLFVSNEAHKRVFRPLADWLEERN